MLCSDCFIILFSSPFVLTEKKNGASFQMIRKDYLLLLFKLALNKENNSLSHCIVLFVLQKSTFKKHAQSKDIFSVFFPVFSSLITEMYPFIYVFAQMRRVKGTYHMDILLHIMILYYILYTYKTKYTCLFLRPVNILAVLSVLLEGFSIMRFIRSSV